MQKLELPPISKSSNKWWKHKPLVRKYMGGIICSFTISPMELIQNKSMVEKRNLINHYLKKLKTELYNTILELKK